MKLLPLKEELPYYLGVRYTPSYYFFFFFFPGCTGRAMSNKINHK